MSLQNLAKIGQLHPHEARPDEIGRLIAAAQRNLKDAKREENSAENKAFAPDDVTLSVVKMAMLQPVAA
jgi:hypothetical protein